ncbi:type II toxin-antitoxin system antitoxin SocA domain-containing protein [Lysinibacillus sp. KU-BSD001]|uniref:type II toxin-antitoxin system antitoxin SocA domain-containing protein n=1 Tax=Lysinibacillus sp. KU-BSD001 TaxID=3141328 RepID=UPI0036E3BB3B
MKKFCLECCEDREVTITTQKRTQTLHNIDITYDAKIYICSECGMDVPDDELYSMNLQQAYRVYKEKNELLLAEDFRYIRVALYQITVRTFAKIIGCSPATITKYEKGAIQTPQHEMTFRLLRNPTIMVQYVEKNKAKLEESEYFTLKERLDFLLEALRMEKILTTTDTPLKFPELKRAEEISMIPYQVMEEYFIIRGYEESKNEYDTLITNKKLQNLSYFTQGWHLAFTDEPLISNDFEAWRHGPVIHESYHKHQHLGANPLPPVNKNIVELGLLSYQEAILDWVWDKYHHFDAQYLEKLSHIEGPWVKARVGLTPIDGSNRIISKEAIHNYFKNVYKAIKLIRSAY